MKTQKQQKKKRFGNMPKKNNLYLNVKRTFIIEINRKITLILFFIYQKKKERKEREGKEREEKGNQIFLIWRAKFGFDKFPPNPLKCLMSLISAMKFLLYFLILCSWIKTSRVRQTKPPKKNQNSPTNRPKHNEIKLKLPPSFNFPFSFFRSCFAFCLLFCFCF